MKFIYVDESGTGEEPIAVMSGVIADAYRMRKTKQHWEDLLYSLEQITGFDIDEFHTHRFYPGNGLWRTIDGGDRATIIELILKWLAERKHDVVYTCIDKQKFQNQFNGHEFGQDLDSLWKTMAFHLTLSIQKHLQGAATSGTRRKKASKRNAVLVFDHQHREQEYFTDLLLDPPEWSQTYYDKVKHQLELGKIIDVPHFVDSTKVGLIQLADFISYFLRKFLEIENGYEKESYDGEYEKLSKWKDMIDSRCIRKSNMYLKRGRCDAAQFFYDLAPETL